MPPQQQEQQQRLHCPPRPPLPLPPHQGTKAVISGSLTDLTVGALFLASITTLLLIGCMLLSSSGGEGLLSFASDNGGSVMRLRAAPRLPPANGSSSPGGDIEPSMLQYSGDVGVARCALLVSRQKVGNYNYTAIGVNRLICPTPALLSPPHTASVLLSCRAPLMVSMSSCTHGSAFSPCSLRRMREKAAAAALCGTTAAATSVVAAAAAGALQPWSRALPCCPIARCCGSSLRVRPRTAPRSAERGRTRVRAFGWVEASPPIPSDPISVSVPICGPTMAPCLPTPYMHMRLVIQPYIHERMLPALTSPCLPACPCRSCKEFP